MTADRRHRSEDTQPELPLRRTDIDPDDLSGREWRLDERTRMIGRQGVAAARARLGRAGAGGATGTGPRNRPGNDHGPTGRAA